ncbi:ATP-binding protein [Streptomyces sp. H39-S7]|uniref:ATP-binding protein n=1 Tax=Streptomyces sp. H39-S7 TaxID=3004357 RepID=UPI0022AF13BC|nr:ATP-binding protein [Streptomyces sp. H39-S7]MCZ4122221.1 ATP-binding protein [Streptomyces sp. H39-S7]
MPGPDFSLVFPPDPVWVRSAREAVRALLRSARRDDLTDTALLLTSEVVTNAVNACHSSGCSIPVTLSAEWTRADASGTLRVLVHDSAPGLPAGRAAEGGDESGRGLALIGDCATEWGVRATDAGPGKFVWFTL